MGQANQGAAFNHGIRGLAAIIGCNATAGHAVVYLDVLVTVFGGHILGIAVDGNHPVDAPDIGAARSGCQLAGVQADVYILEGIAVIQGGIGKSVVDGLHDHLPQPACRVLIVIGQVNLLWLIVAAPDCCRVIFGVACKPAVTVAGGCAGFAGNVLAGKNRHRAGAVVGRIIQAIVHIIDCLLAENLLRFLLIVQHNLSVTVIDFGVGARRADNAVVGKGCVGSSHFPDGRANSQCAQCQGSDGNIRHWRAVGGHIAVHQIILLEIVFSKAKAGIRTDTAKGIG